MFSEKKHQTDNELTLPPFSPIHLGTHDWHPWHC